MKFGKEFSCGFRKFLQSGVIGGVDVGLGNDYNE